MEVQVDSSFLSSGEEILQALIEGWPDSDKLYDLAIQSARRMGRELDDGIARAYLLATSKLSAQRDKDLAEVIRNEKFFFWHTGDFNFSANNSGPEVMSALDDYLVGLEKFQSHYIARVAVITKSPRAKGRLLELPRDPGQSNWIFWPVWALLTGWGTQDPEVRATLEPLAQMPKDKVPR